MSEAVGIDLGTTISLLARRVSGGPVELVRTRDGSARLRSVVHVGADGAATVGEAAQRAAGLDPDSVFGYFKRSMGERWRVEAGGRAWTPEDLSAAVLGALADDAGAESGQRPREAVITIPAYFGDDARRATQRAAEIARLDARALLHEPTAACLAYRQPSAADATVLVFDLGGGTFDVSVVRFAGAEAQVTATLGDHRLGGKDWDDVLASQVAERVEALCGEDPYDDPAVLAELEERARTAKHALSRVARTAVTVPVSSGLQRVEVTAAEFFAAATTLFERTAELLARVVDQVGGPSALDEVLLVGGSTRMPPCADVVRRVTGLDPQAGIDPDEAVAAGAAIYAASLAAPAAASIRRIRDITAHALGFVVVSADGSRYVNEVMIERNAPIPAAATKRHALEVPARAGGCLEVHMLQGDAERPLDTQPLGLWRFDDIQGGRKGSVEIDVTYRYDADGVVHVEAAVDGRPLGAPAIDRDARDLRWTAEDPRSQRTPTFCAALAIDVSSSMSGESLGEAKAACNAFVDELDAVGAAGRIALVCFSNDAARVARIGDGTKRLRRGIASLAAGGGTDMAAGLRTAGRALDGADGQRIVVLLTDGMPNDQAVTLRERDALVDAGIEIVARGVTGADAQFLARLATGDGQLLDLSQLASSFRGIARQLGGSTAMRTTASHGVLGRR